MIEQASEDTALVEEQAASDWAIAIEGMRKAYGRTLAVRNLSMHVPRGSIYGFVGPNGAGKTTTIRTLATLQSADEGSVLVDGIDVERDPGAVRDRVGYMPDFFGVYDSLTVWEYLNFYGSMHRVPSKRRHQVCEELLELIDLSDKRKDSVESLSRGMKQRLGLARCLVHDPEVLLLDEPASGMDPRARVELREILRELSSLNKTILISSHILPELAEMCTHIGIIRDGEMLAEGSVGEIVATLAGSARLRVRLVHGASPDQALAIIAAYPGSQDVEVDENGSLVASLIANPNAEPLAAEHRLADLLSRLISAGVPVIGFGLEGGTLEDIFLQITELGEVSA